MHLTLFVVSFAFLLLFQFSIGDATPQHVESLKALIKGFNSLLEMRVTDVLGESGRDLRGVFQFSIGDAVPWGMAVGLCEGELFQFSIGDAGLQSTAPA